MWVSLRTKGLGKLHFEKRGKEWNISCNPPNPEQTGDLGSSSPVVPYREWPSPRPQGHTRQCLETLLMVTIGGSYGHPLGRGQGCCYTSHSAQAQNLNSAEAGSPDLINSIKQVNPREIKWLVHDRAGRNPLTLKSKILISPICSALRFNLLQVWDIKKGLVSQSMTRPQAQAPSGTFSTASLEVLHWHDISGELPQAENVPPPTYPNTHKG